MVKLGVLGSTRGTDLQAIIDAIHQNELDAEIKVVISNKEDAYILERARKANIPAVYISQKEKSREEFDREIMNVLEEKKVVTCFLESDGEILILRRSEQVVGISYDSVEKLKTFAQAQSVEFPLLSVTA